MASGFTYFLRDNILDDVFGGDTYTPPTNWHVGLSTTIISEDGTGATEPADGYARVEVANNLTNFPASTNGEKSNGTEITFPEATGEWGEVTYFFISDASTLGNMVAFGQLTIAKVIQTGDTARFQVGDLQIILGACP